MIPSNRIGIIFLSAYAPKEWHMKLPIWAYPLGNYVTLVELKIRECLEAGCKTIYISTPLKWIPFFKKYYFDTSLVSKNSLFNINFSQALMIPSMPIARFREKEYKFCVRFNHSLRMAGYIGRAIASSENESYIANSIYITSDHAVFNFLDKDVVKFEENTIFSSNRKEGTEHLIFPFLIPLETADSCTKISSFSASHSSEEIRKVLIDKFDVKEQFLDLFLLNKNKPIDSLYSHEFFDLLKKIHVNPEEKLYQMIHQKD